MAVVPEVAYSPARRFSIRGLFGGGKSADSDGGTPPPEQPSALIEGVITDQKVLQHVYKLQGLDVQPIATDTFLDKSRDVYNSAWLTRELVQNFVDHNQQTPGTLNGVGFEVTTLPNGKRRFVITGNWPFEDPTGVLSPHSKKPQDRNTAGGNGIGLKQTAIRLLRDFGVDRFEIQGEGWTVNYQLAKAAAVNIKWRAIPGQTPLYQVRHDWLLADLKKTDGAGSTSYVIETTNPELIKALEQFPTLGVSENNPYLQDMDYSNDQGAFKWLPKGEAGKPTRGRLFINGQVMNFSEKGTTAEDYWVGPEYITIQLNDQEYDMSIDRPPIDAKFLDLYLNNLVSWMSRDDLIKQLQRSEYLWGGYKSKGYFEKEGAEVVFEKLAKKLGYDYRYDKTKYQEYFPNRKYLAHDSRATDAQLKELEEQGYIICPEYMSRIGMPTISSMLTSVESVGDLVPQLTTYQRERIAQEVGIEVGFEDFPDISTPQAFFTLIRDRLQDRMDGVEPNIRRPDIYRITLRDSIAKELLFHTLPHPRSEAQKYLYFLRGIAKYGLEKVLFAKIFHHQADFVTTFAVSYDPVTESFSLTTRNIPNKGGGATYLEVELNDQHLDAFKAAFGGIATDERAVATGSTPHLDQGSDISRQAEGKIVKAGEGETQRWTPEEERLYQLALQKKPHELTEADKAAIEQRKALAARLKAIPVAYPAAPGREFHGQIIPKAATLSDAEKIRLAQMEQELPGIVEAVNKLDNLIPNIAPQAPTGESPTEKYMDWRETASFYGRVADLANTAGYITGKHLLELINEQNQAEIDVVDAQREKSPGEHTLYASKNKLEAVVKRMIPKEDDVNEFDLVYEPSENQLAQLGLLRLYTRIVTGADVPNDLFIYRGTGSKGINLGRKGIGLHEALFSTQFSEVLQTFAHEVAHNQNMTHGDEWRNTLEALFVTMVNRISNIGNKAQRGEALTKEESAILQIQDIWDKLRTQEVGPVSTLPPALPSLGS